MKNRYLRSSKVQLFLAFLLNSALLFGATQSATYSGGDIPTAENNWPGDNGACTAAVLTVTIPLASNEVAEVTGVDVTYEMTAQNSGWKSEQNSQIYYVEGSSDEGAYAQGSGSSSGVQTYSRTGLTLANGISTSGVLNFEMHDYRTWSSSGHSGCDVYNNKVDDNTWTVTVNYDILIDTDDDGVPDRDDIDDDNDGIIDTLEGSVLPNNGGFEEPDISPVTTWTTKNDVDVPFWTTTATDHKIEFWKSGFQGIDAYDGDQLVELNANEVASLYQDIAVTPGDIVSWKVAHRGRTSASSPDVATVSMGIPGATLTIQETMSDTNVAWGVYTGHYVIPAGMTQIRVSFDSVSSASSSLSVGNMLDGVRLIVVKDDDGDALRNHIDLDSDNDGIPDNVEAQSTIGYLVTRDPIVDTDGNGLDDQYESAPGTGEGLVTPDSDGDGIPDFLDSDSDNDLVSDCKESYTSGTICPVDNTTPGNTVGGNGLVAWAETVDDYTNPNGIVITPTVDLADEISNDNEVAYREVACGPAEVTLTHLQWKTVSFPCDLANNTLEEILGGPNGLGTYGNDAQWVMYEQVSPDYSGGGLHMMLNTDPVVAGKGYWIIADLGGAGVSKTVGINRPLDGISRTPTQPASGFTGVPTTGQSFDELMNYTLPDSSTEVQKVLVGNPFFKKFQLSDMYYHNSTYQSGDYVSMVQVQGDESGAVQPPLKSTVYIHDSADTSNTSYIAIVPETPGFEDVIPTMQGFWIRLNPNNSGTNEFAYPLEK